MIQSISDDHGLLVGPRAYEAYTLRSRMDSEALYRYGSGVLLKVAREVSRKGSRNTLDDPKYFLLVGPKKV